MPLKTHALIAFCHGFKFGKADGSVSLLSIFIYDLLRLILDKSSQAPLFSSPAQSKMLHDRHDICSNISPVACVKT